MDKEELIAWIHQRIGEETDKIDAILRNQTYCGVTFIAGEETAYRDVLEKLSE